jgi:NAD(P)-dependent dehydrogenase (short-subunit alcohol dehydrogenase family)
LVIYAGAQDEAARSDTQMSDPPRARGAVLVTGSSTGIGRASALHLDRLGFEVYAGIRREADGESLRAESDGRIAPVTIDVTDEGSIRAAADEISAARGGRLAGLVNNAGVPVGGPLEAVPLEDLRRVLEVNVVGQVAVTQAFLPMLRAARGRVILMSSIGGRNSVAFLGPYSASKHALEAIGDALRQELSQFGVEVVLVEPGSIETKIWDKSEAEVARFREEADPDRLAPYEHNLENVEAAIRKTAERGLPAEKVGEVVGRAMTARRPRTRYVVGTDAKVQAVAKRLLPDRLMDRLAAREIGI